MKKIIMAVCSAAVILACYMLTPVSVCAQERSCDHDMLDHYYEEVSDIFAYSHQVFLYNGSNGPVYESCSVHRITYNVYPRCSKCGYVFIYNQPTETIVMYHKNLNCPLHH